LLLLLLLVDQLLLLQQHHVGRPASCSRAYFSNQAILSFFPRAASARLLSACHPAGQQTACMHLACE
jgi:hypothetical protein